MVIYSNPPIRGFPISLTLPPGNYITRHGDQTSITTWDLATCGGRPEYFQSLYNMLTRQPFRNAAQTQRNWNNSTTQELAWLELFTLFNLFLYTTVLSHECGMRFKAIYTFQQRVILNKLTRHETKTGEWMPTWVRSSSMYVSVTLDATVSIGSEWNVRKFHFCLLSDRNPSQFLPFKRH